MSKAVSSLLIVILFIAAVGCGGSHISGTVYVNDREVEFGTISFTPDLDNGSDGPTIIAKVRNGSMEFMDNASSTSGTNTVTLVVSKEWLTGEKVEVEEFGVLEEGEGGIEPDLGHATFKQKFDLPAAGNSFDLRFEYNPEEAE
jgi:hypothetical protein